MWLLVILSRQSTNALTPQHAMGPGGLARDAAKNDFLLVQGMPVPGLAADHLSQHFPFPLFLLLICDSDKRCVAGNSMHTASAASMFLVGMTVAIG